MSRFMNDDARLLERVDATREARSKNGLEGLTTGLEAVVLSVQPEDLKPAVQELLRYTGLVFQQAFEDPRQVACVLTSSGGADFIVRSRKTGDNPFRPFNLGPKSAHKPDARLETFIYGTRDLERYQALQQARGVRFQTQTPEHHAAYGLVQTFPSPHTGNALGFVQWHGPRNWLTSDATPLDWRPEKPELAHLARIGRLDHSATRVRADHRDDAIIEFMELTDYDFQFAVYVESLNSITNVARLGAEDYAQVFTSGIAPFSSLEESGPTEKFIHNYGLRVHHLALETRDILEVYPALRADGLEFLVELVGSREEGLHQTFSAMSPHTFLVNEYIQRYDGFDGFFTKSNVTELTRATEKQ